MPRFFRRGSRRRRAGPERSTQTGSEVLSRFFSTSGQHTRTAVALEQKGERRSDLCRCQSTRRSRNAYCIDEYTGRLSKQGNSITTFADRVECLYRPSNPDVGQRKPGKICVIFSVSRFFPLSGTHAPSAVTSTSLQSLLNRIAERGYCRSAI